MLQTFFFFPMIVAFFDGTLPFIKMLKNKNNIFFYRIFCPFNFLLCILIHLPFLLCQNRFLDMDLYGLQMIDSLRSPFNLPHIAFKKIVNFQIDLSIGVGNKNAQNGHKQGDAQKCQNEFLFDCHKYAFFTEEAG